MNDNRLIYSFSRKTFRIASTLLGWLGASLLLLSGNGLSQAAEPAEQRDKSAITIDADTLSFDQRTNIVEAQGNVEIRREDVILKADQVRVNRETQDAEAQGRVSVDHPEGWLRGESVRFNLGQETGQIKRGEIFLEKNQLSMSGRRFEKFAGQVYHVDEGFFTTCLCESGPPSWKISGREIDLNRNGEGVVKGGTFYILDYPIFYLPYGVFPVRTERQSGFLFPKFGFSNKEGFRYQQPFFWAISKSADATITPHIESRARVGLLGEYRQIFSRSNEVEIATAYFNEELRNSQDIGINRNIADTEIPRNRWNVFANHRQVAPSGWATYSDIDAFSDDLFTRELLHTIDRGRTSERVLKTSRFSRSRFGFLRQWEQTELRGEWSFYQDFIQEDNRTFHRTPQVIFRGSRFLGENIPLELRWRAEGINYQREEGADGLRFDLRPEFVLPFRLAPYLSGSLDVAPRQTLYYLYRTEGVFDRGNSRELVEVRGRVGTSLSRVFSLAFGELQQLKHVLDPELRYLFVPATRQRDIPIFDDTDRINRRNMLTFSLTNRFWGKFVHEPSLRLQDEDIELLDVPATTELREMGRLSVALSYDIDKERKGGDALSDLDTRLVLTPLRYLALSFDLGLNPGPWQVRKAAGTFSIRDPRPIRRRVLDPDFMIANGINLSYHFIRRNFLTPLADNANLTMLPPEHEINRNAVGSFNASLNYRLTDHLLFRFSSNYNARDGRFTNNGGSLKILSQCECWSVLFSLKRSVNPDRTLFDVQFMLLGLGSASPSFGSQTAAGSP